jgi:hypothetical protein
LTFRGKSEDQNKKRLSKPKGTNNRVATAGNTYLDTHFEERKEIKEIKNKNDSTERLLQDVCASHKMNLLAVLCPHFETTRETIFLLEKSIKSLIHAA